jgi:hypothetical protein
MLRPHPRSLPRLDALTALCGNFADCTSAGHTFAAGATDPSAAAANAFLDGGSTATADRGKGES